MHLKATNSSPRLRTALLAAFAAGAALLAGAAERYVATSGNNSDGSSWANAYTNLQTAIDAAGPGDTIYLKGETFSANTTVQLNSQIVWQNKGLTLLGGYAGDGGTPGALAATPTVLTQPANGTSRILYLGGVTNGMIERVTFTGGKPSVNDGAAIYINRCSNVTVVACMVTNNLGFQNGGAIYVVGAGGSVSFTNCVVRQNSFANDGGGGKQGGGLRIASGTVRMDDCVIAQNRMRPSGNTPGHGAGAYVDGNLILRNCLIYGNTANWSASPNAIMSSSGDGLYLNSGTLTLENCTVAHNLGEGIRRAGGSMTVRNSILWGNFAGDVLGVANLAACNVQDGTGNGVNGCISVDPLFRNGYYLDPDSPCVDAGNVTAAVAGLEALTTRTDGVADSGSSQVDLGYHYATGFDTTYDDIYVAKNGDDVNNSGTSPSEPFASITNALTHVRDGSRVHIAAGTYGTASEAFPLRLADRIGVQILGAGADTTLIDASGANQRVLSLLNIAGASRLEGLTFRGGNPTDIGGGLYLELCSDLTLAACAVVDNSTRDRNYGNGILAMDSGLTLTNSIVARNFGSANGGGGKSGGGICAFYGRLRMRDSTLANNRLWPSANTTSKGGGLYLNGGAATLRNCLIYGNDANYASSGTIGLGDGVYVETGTAALTVEHSTVAYNLGEGLRRDGGSLAVSHSIIQGHTADIVGAATLASCNIGDGRNNGTNGCFAADALFRNGYYLSAASPCVNAGSVTAAAAGLDGRTTQVNGTSDSEAVDLGYHYASGTDTAYDDIYVAMGGSDGNTGTSLGAPLRTLTNALAKARDGSRIHIAAGTYDTATERFPLALTNRIGVQLLGAGAAETIINASGSNNRVLTLSDLGGTTVIAGLKLTGGNPGGHGGGVYMTRCGGLTFSGVSVTNNASNSGTRGMGIYSENCVFAMTDCLIADNRSSASGGGGKMGGGIYLLCAHALIDETVIANNRMTPSFNTTGDGGGVCQDSGTLTLRNVLLIGNDGSDVGNATGRGDGIHLYAVGTMALENCTIADNLGQGVHREWSGTITVRNSILWSNGDDVVGTVALRYSNVEDGDQIGVNGNIQSDPQFVDAASRNYRLKRSSTSVNAGEYQPWMTGATDLDGSPRVQNKVVDLGAYETYLPLGGTTILVR